MGSCSSKDSISHSLSSETVKQIQKSSVPNTKNISDVTATPRSSEEHNPAARSSVNDNMKTLLAHGSEKRIAGFHSSLEPALETFDSDSQFSKSKQHYRKKTGVTIVSLDEKSILDENNTFQSGLYNRHLLGQKSDVNQLLQRDTFSMLGSKLQQEENRILSKYTDQDHDTPRSLSPKNSVVEYEKRASFAKKCGIFDATKFRAANTAAVNNDFSKGITVGQFHYRDTGANLDTLMNAQDDDLIKKLEDEFSYN